MDDLKAPAATWAHEVQKYEQEKRRVVDEGLVNNRQVRVTGAQTKAQERCFDPLLQRYRDPVTELQQRTLEERERVSHLNRAYDISILRGQPFNVVTHENKLEALAPGSDPLRLGHEKPRNKEAGRPGSKYPDQSVDFNIVSNIPHEHHHWARPEARPHIAEKLGKDRLVPAFTVKDFDIITNRYKDGHEERHQRDKQYSLLEATKKHAKENRFDPLTQQFNDPRHEELAKTADHAREVELTMRLENQLPPTMKGTESKHYDILSHQVHDPTIIDMLDTHQVERKGRFKNRYIFEHNMHKQDIKGDHINESRKLNRIAPERYQEDAIRGYDLINNKRYGRLHHEKHLHDASTKPRLTPWEKIELGKSTKPEELVKSDWLTEGAYLESLSSCYYGDGKPRGADRTFSANSSAVSERSAPRRQLAASASAPALSPAAPVAEAAPASASSGGAKPVPAAPMPPGQTAPLPRAAATLVQAGSRALSERSRSSTQLRASEAVDNVRTIRPPPQSLRHSESMGATALGPTLRGPSEGMSAPPAPAIPGSPLGSCYSRKM